MPTILLHPTDLIVCIQQQRRNLRTDAYMLGDRNLSGLLRTMLSRIERGVNQVRMSVLRKLCRTLEARRAAPGLTITALEKLNSNLQLA